MAGFDVVSIFNSVGPVLKWIIYGIVILLLVAVLVYVAFFMRKPRKWQVHILEQKNDGKIEYIYDDILIRKLYNFGKQVRYMFKLSKLETVPPPEECVYNKKGKDHCWYIRKRNHHVPLQANLILNANWTDNVKEAILSFKTKKVENIEQEYIYAPLKMNMAGNLELKPIPYEMEVMRTNMIENGNVVYADRKNLLQQIAPWVGLFAVCIAVVFVIYFSYQFATDSIMKVSSQLGPIAEALSKIAQNQTGKPPI